MSQNSRNQGFFYYICLMLEGSGSGRPKNTWIRWIRIRNTGLRSSRIWRRGRPPALLLAPPPSLPQLFASPSASPSGRPLRPRQLGPGGGGPLAGGLCSGDQGLAGLCSGGQRAGWLAVAWMPMSSFQSDARIRIVFIRNRSRFLGCIIVLRIRIP